MAAPTNAANVKKALANSEPSTHGTKQTSKNYISMSAFEGKADIAADWTQTDFYGFTKFVGWPSTGSIIRPTA
jgi:hypothetical protein